MQSRRFAGAMALTAVLALALAAPVQGQIPRQLKDAVQDAAEKEAARQLDRLIRDAIRCALNDPGCYEEAQASGEEVIFVDEEGQVIADDEGVPITDRQEAMATVPPPDPPEKKGWRLDAGGEQIEGRIAYVGRGDGQLAIQLVNKDAVNLILVIPDDGTSERNVEAAHLAFGRGAPCALVASEPPFHVQFEAIDGEWLIGSYAGMLACQDYSVLPVRGAFRIENPGE